MWQHPRPRVFPMSSLNSVSSRRLAVNGRAVSGGNSPTRQADSNTRSSSPPRAGRRAFPFPKDAPRWDFVRQLLNRPLVMLGCV